MPKVTLISRTPDARELLIFTKSTRLNMTPGSLQTVMFMSEEDKERELQAMARTIRSSWEFVDVTFLIEGTTRAIAQQITRTRNASYAMQSLRVVDATDIPITNPFEPTPPLSEFPSFKSHNDACDNENEFSNVSDCCRGSYAKMIERGASKEDARGILPMNTQTTLVAKYNLRAFVDLVAARSSLRVQGEYSDIVRQMKSAVLAVWPWAAPFFVHPQDDAIKMLEAAVAELGLETGKGVAWEIAKAIDLLRKSEG